MPAQNADRSESMAFGRRRLLALSIAAALGTVVGAVLLDSRTPATADRRPPAPWCAFLGTLAGAYDCGYYTFEQCMATARGLGGYCSPNPWAIYAPPPPPRRARR
jgi:Protein of unknown function (DUF3551)